MMARNASTSAHCESEIVMSFGTFDKAFETLVGKFRTVVLRRRFHNVEITAIDGKWKVSQNRGEADRRGVAEGLTGMGTAEAGAMAELVKTYGGLD